MVYVAPLRAAVLWLAERPYRWDAWSLSTLAHVSEGAARGYAGHLVLERVLVRDELAMLHKGMAFDPWAEAQPPTRPGGSSRRYLRDRESRAQVYFDEQQERLRLGQRLRELRTARGLGITRLAREAHVGMGVILAIERGKWNPGQETLGKLERALGGTLCPSGN